MKKIYLNLDRRSYTISIGKGVLTNLPDGLEKYFPSNRVVVITNRTISKIYKKRIGGLLKNRFDVSWIEIQDGESYKNLKTAGFIYNRLVRLGVDRKTGLIALGGGVVGDMAGFAAATFLRGIPYVQVPTSLLAQVDSSVGGKTGFDLSLGKNLVGAFCQPKWVLADTDFLDSLPKREFLCGLSEVVKYGILRDANLFSFIEKNTGKILRLNHNTLEFLIWRSLAIKALVVSRDEKDFGLRSLLNLGHTIGHAVETLSGYKKIRHGEAVSMGLAYAALLSCKRGYCGAKTAERITGVLKNLGLPAAWPPYSKKLYRKAIAVDKKAEGGKIKYIAIRKIGTAFAVPLTTEEITRYL